MTKTEFVRRAGMKVSAKQVAAAGAKKGLKLTPNVVHAIRTQIRKKDGAASGKAAKAPARQAGAMTREGADMLVKAVLKSAACELGFSNAIAFLCSEQAASASAIRALVP